MSTSEFQKYFAEDATGALTKFISGLGNLQDESALKFLDDMGISETRLRDALLRASNANDLFTSAMNRTTNVDVTLFLNIRRLRKFSVFRNLSNIDY